MSDESNNQDSQINLFPIVLYSSILGISFFSWSFYKSSSFRRSVLENSFNTYDYLYDKFHKVWYDDKIRITNLTKKDIKIADVHQSFLKNSNLESTTSDDLDGDSECEDKLEEDLNTFLNNNLYLQNVSIKDKNHYFLGTKPNLNFKTELILEMPWLAASLEITTNDDNTHTHDITESIQKFCIDGNFLPIHLEYYDFWIDILLHDTGVSKNHIHTKDKIKEIKMVTINEYGDFIDYKNILIVPRKGNFKIINFPQCE